jgi:hypothetical protein
MAERTYSWSQVQTYQDCGQKGKWQYEEGYRERTSADSRSMMLGSAVHAGMEAYMKAITVGTVRATAVNVAADAIREWARRETKPYQQYFDWSSRSLIYDTDYYVMMREVPETAIKLVTYYHQFIPTSWVIATKKEVIPSRYSDGSIARELGQSLALEWKIYHTMPDGQQFTGVVDAVIRDTETGNIFLVDWKVKTSLPHDNLAMLDGQLGLYAAVLNANGANIREVVMVQMKADLPANPEIGEGKNLGTVLTGRKSYATTWEHWSANLPMGVDASKYEALMKPKMKDVDYFFHPVTSPVTKHSSQFALDNMQAAINMIEGGNLPARLSAYHCSHCVFARLCDAKKYGSDVEFLAGMYLDKRS